MFEAAGHRSFTFTTIAFSNGPVYDGEYGSLYAVILKQRPQASPKLERAPNARVLTAAVYPDDILPPHAEKGGHRVGQHGLREPPNHENSRRRTYRHFGSRCTQ